MSVGGYRFGLDWVHSSKRVGLALCMAMASASLVRAAEAPTAEAPAIKVYAAGSLREVMNALERAYFLERRNATPAQTTPAFQFLFGPSGKLREKIEAGEAVHIFASASPSHTERLVAAGKLRSSNVFASNSLCVIARPDVPMSESTLIDTLLAPNVVLGTSTPGADPSGDYTWEMFNKIDTVRPGAFATLDAKAKKLTGAEVNASDKTSPYAQILLAKRADVFVTYCTNGRIAQQTDARITSVKVPAEFDVATSYAIGLAPDAPDTAREFVRFVLSQRAQKLMAAMGFSAPALLCAKVEPILKDAHEAWTGRSIAVSAAAGRAPDNQATIIPVIPLAKRLAMTLQPVKILTFKRRSRENADAGKPSFGGMVEFTPPVSGHLEVFLDQRAWIDVVRVRDQTAATAVRSDRWLGCAGVGKNLGFDVVAGEKYELRLSEIDNTRAVVLLMQMQLTATAASPPK